MCACAFAFVQNIHLFFSTQSNLWVGLYLHVVVAQVALETERPDFSGEIVSDLTLLGVVANSTANVILATLAPNIERHLKSDSQKKEGKSHDFFPWCTLGGKVSHTSRLECQGGVCLHVHEVDVGQCKCSGNPVLETTKEKVKAVIFFRQKNKQTNKQTKKKQAS
jgi:hypothetical protein